MILKYLANLSMLLKMAILCGASLCVLSSAQAQEKIGYISSQRIVNEALPYKAASAKLEQEFSKRAKDLHDMETRLKDMQDKLEKEQRELQEDLSQRRNEELATVLDRVNKVIAQIAESEKYDIVVQDALYHSARVDITDKVLKILNKP